MQTRRSLTSRAQSPMHLHGCIDDGPGNLIYFHNTFTTRFSFGSSALDLQRFGSRCLCRGQPGGQDAER
jgi:hypothetical protein